jgi:hypothetical protein
MDRREVAVAVPTRVVEIVSRVAPSSIMIDWALSGHARRARWRATAFTDRLIWTNDNYVALQTLLDEKGPSDPRLPLSRQGRPGLHRPPFMVNSDFRADNAIDIGSMMTSPQRRPSLVEIAGV